MTDEVTTTTNEPTLADIQAKLEEAIKGNEALKAKNDELLAEKRKAQAKAEQEAEARQKAADEAAAKSGDVESLTKSFEERLAKREAELTKERDEYRAKFHDLTVGAKVREISAAVSKDFPDLVEPFAARRIALDGDKYQVRDDNGNLTANTVEDLIQELRNDPRFAAIVEESRMSGGGVAGVKGGSATKSLSEMGDAERVAWARRDPEGFAKASALKN